MHHSDRGGQYASLDFQDKLAAYGMACSMNRKGNCWDNAPSDSFFVSLKNERVHTRRYATRNEAIADVFDCIEPLYNRRRRHSARPVHRPPPSCKLGLNGGTCNTGQLKQALLVDEKRREAQVVNR